MLKKCYGLFLGLVVLAGSACVTPTHASSASIMMTQIRAGGTSSALEEGVVIYNNSVIEVDVTNWCLTNKTHVTFACITPQTNEKIIIPAYGNATIVSEAGQVHTQDNAYVAVYESSNQSSGAIVASSDTISLLNADGQIVDHYSWTSSVSSTQQWARISLSILPYIYLDTDASTDWQKTPYTPLSLSYVEYHWPDDGPEEEGEGDPAEVVEVSPTPLPLIITELLPNAIGSDTGNEFIEVFNPNEDVGIQLNGYKLLVGSALEKAYILADYLIHPGEYIVLTNTDYAYTLLNTSSRVSLADSDGTVISEAPPYNSPTEGYTWALIDTVWQYTNQPTPGAKNLPSIVIEETDVNEAAAEATDVKPCASNQYRSPETNRCRLVSSTSTGTLMECKVGQERNPETNRCRNIATTSEAAPCKQGQERNPDTNRCRNVKALVSADFGVKGATTQQQAGMSWYMWAAIGGIVLLVIGYAVWEWREELKKLFHRMKEKFARRAN